MVKQLEVGHCYHIKWMSIRLLKNFDETLAIVNCIKQEEIFVSSLASTSFGIDLSRSVPTFITLKTFDLLKNDIHEVTDIKDLPLYLGWKYTSPELSNLIKQGTWEAYANRLLVGNH